MSRSWTALLACLVLLIAAWAVVRPDQLYVERIVFVGNERAGDVALRHLTDVRNGTTIWQVDLAKVSAGVQRHPWIASVRTERSFPTTLVVRVTEHEPTALVAWGDTLLYADSSGRPFLEADSDDLDYPVVTGIGPELEAMHPDLARWALHDALWLLEQLDTRKILARDDVSEVSFSRTRGFAVHASGAAAGRPASRVLFGFGGYERQLAHLESLLDQGVDLSMPLQVDVAPETVAIVRRLTPDASPPGARAPHLN